MVTIYIRKNCPWCTKLKSYLKNNNVNYNEIDIIENPSAIDDLIRFSKQSGVPTINIDGRYIIGFDKSLIDESLNIK